MKARNSERERLNADEICNLLIENGWLVISVSADYNDPDGGLFTFKCVPRGRATKTNKNPKRIIKDGPATIVFWRDGTKTVVKRAEDEPDNDYAAFTAALAIKVLGNNSKVRKIVAKTERKR